MISYSNYLSLYNSKTGQIRDIAYWAVRHDRLRTLICEHLYSWPYELPLSTIEQCIISSTLCTPAGPSVFPSPFTLFQLFKLGIWTISYGAWKIDSNPKRVTVSNGSIQEHFLFNIELFRFWIICFPKVNFCFRRLSNEMRSELLFHSQTNAFLYSNMTELTSHEPIWPQSTPFDPFRPYLNPFDP